ncbi:MAG: tetratricopeptide repeat protein [Planctomycetota bacterium]|jgi:tetratricopeptide (TPR) repeat protein
MEETRRHKKIKAPYTSADSRKQLFVVVVVLLCVTSAVYWQVRNHEFISLDDPKYVTANRQVQAGLSWENIKWAFTTKHASNWHPLTWLSHMLDCHLFGRNAGWHHFVNLLFHLVNTLLLLFVLHRMTKALWPSAFVAAMFALHPLHTESVAWVAERKDVLGMFFWLLTMWAYAAYAEHPGFIKYMIVLLVLALGLMVKPMLMTVPFVLLMVDYWPLRRFGGNELKVPAAGNGPQTSSFRLLLLEKLPLFILAVVSGVITLQAQRATIAPLRALDLHSRIANALVSYIAYIRMTICPAKLTVFYPHTGKIPLWQGVVAAALLIVVSLLIIRWRRRCPYMLAGWLWYLGTLVPVIGLIQVGTQRYADRYTYIPLVGIFIIIAWGVPDLLKRIHFKKPVLVISAAAVISALAVCTWFQVAYWHSSITLYEHALRVTKNNHLAHNNLGLELKQKGRVNEAMTHFRLALDIFPLYGDAIANLASELIASGRPDEAIKHCTGFLQDGRDHLQIRNNLGNAYEKTGELDQAVKHYQRALQMRPDTWQVHYNLALVLIQKQQLADAVKHLQQAQNFSQNNPVVSKTLADTLNRKRRLDEQASPMK